MAYTRFREQWDDLPLKTTPVTGEALEHIEGGIEAASGDAEYVRGVVDSGRLSPELLFPSRRVLYVDAAAGVDTNSGSSLGTALATIQAAVDRLPDGGTVLVADGVYLPFVVTYSGIHIESIGGRRKTVIQTDDPAVNGVTFLGASALSTLVQCGLKGFTIAGPGKTSGGTGVGVSIKWASVDLTVEDCWITSWGSHGVSVEDSYSMSFVRCLADQNGGDGFHGETNFNNVTFDRTISILNNGRGYAVVGGTTVLFLNADAESNVGAGFDLRYVFAANLQGCHMERNGTDGTSPNIYLHYRVGLSEKATATNIAGCVIQGSGVTSHGVIIDGASRTSLDGNWFSGHVTAHVQTTSNADRSWLGPNTYSLAVPELVDGSATTVRMDYDYANGCARTDVLRLAPRALNPAILAQGQTWWSSTADQFKARDASRIRTVFSGVEGTATLDFGSIAAHSAADLTIPVTGAAVGDRIALGAPALTPGLIPYAFVSAADVVTVRMTNATASAIDPASGGFRVAVLKA